MKQNMPLTSCWLPAFVAVVIREDTGLQEVENTVWTVGLHPNLVFAIINNYYVGFVGVFFSQLLCSKSIIAFNYITSTRR